METSNEKNLATFTHLSVFSKYFIPFGNFIFPLLIWTTNKDKSEFVDYHGKQVLNFQLSFFLYTLVSAMIAIPILIVTFFNTIPLNKILNNNSFDSIHFGLENLTGIAIVALIGVLLFVSLKFGEFFLIIFAAVKASKGEKYQYPLTISFIK